MSILIVGGAGYIGSHTAKLIAQLGIEPVVFDNLVYGHEWAVKWGPFVKGDLADQAALDRLFKDHRIEAVIQFAAYTYVGESVTSPRKYYRNNLVNTLNLLDAMVDHGVRDLVFSSTCATYGHPIAVPISEAHPQNPLNPYGETKLAVEKAMKWYAGAYGMRFAALRYFNAAGADPAAAIGEDHDPETHLIPLAIEAAMLRRPPLEIYGTDTLANHVERARTAAAARGLAFEHLQSNHEGVLVDAIHGARGRCGAIVINPGAFTHYSWAIHDALGAFSGPIVEVHLSNPNARESWRHTSVVAPVATGSVIGFGGHGYVLAIDAVARLLGLGG